MERDRIVIPCHLVFLRVRVSDPYSSVPMQQAVQGHQAVPAQRTRIR